MNNNLMSSGRWREADALGMWWQLMLGVIEEGSHCVVPRSFCFNFNSISILHAMWCPFVWRGSGWFFVPRRLLHVFGVILYFCAAVALIKWIEIGPLFDIHSI